MDRFLFACLKNSKAAMRNRLFKLLQYGNKGEVILVTGLCVFVHVFVHVITF